MPPPPSPSPSRVISSSSGSSSGVKDKELVSNQKGAPYLLRGFPQLTLSIPVRPNVNKSPPDRLLARNSSSAPAR